MGLFNKLFGNAQVDQSAQSSVSSDEAAIGKFQALSGQDRMGAIIRVGDAGKADGWMLIKFASLSDPDLDVRMAALKRLGNFLDRSATVQLLKDMEKQPNHESLEPYLSMAKVRLGMMSKEEFEAKLNAQGLQ